nr:hypothetical protein [Lachnospiraceae bacterium]
DKKEAVNNTPTPTPIVYENRTAEDVRIESTKLEDAKNFEVKEVFDINISIEYLGMTLEMPVNNETVMVTKDDHAHAFANTHTEVFGQQIDNNQEIYYGDGVAYTYTDDAGRWVYSQNDFEQVLKLANVAEMDFTHASCTYNTETETYTIEDTYKNIAGDNEEMKMIFNEAFAALGEYGINGEELFETLGKCTMTYEYDASCRLVYSAMKGFEYTASTDMGNIKMTISLELEYSRYGEVKDEEVIVPESVKESAVPFSAE